MFVRFLVCLLPLVGLSNGAGAEPGSSIRISAYEFSVRYAPPDSGLNITADLSLVNPGSDSSVAFLFSSRVRIGAINWIVGPDTLTADYHQSPPETLVIAVPRVAMRQSESKLNLTYLYPLQANDSTMILLDRGHRWYPLIPTNIAQCRMRLNVPKGWFAVTGGDLVSIDSAGQSVQSVWQSHIPMFKVMLGIGRSEQYVQLSEKAEPTTLFVICRPVDSVSAREILQEAAKAFAYFSQRVGPYPHLRLTFIETSMFPGANLGTSIVALGSDMLGPMDRGRAAMLDLAVASQWFGAGVFGKFQEEGFWFLTLSLPHYERLLYLRDTQGEEAFRKDLDGNLDRYRKFAGSANDIPILRVDYLNTQEKGNAVAFKGPYLLDRVRQKMGDEPWRAFVRTLYTKKSGQMLTCREFLHELDRFDHHTAYWLSLALVAPGMPEK